MDRNQLCSLSSLTSELQRLTNTLESIMAKNNLPFPSLDVDGPPEYPKVTGDDDDTFTRTRYQIVDAARKLTTLVLGPREALLHFSFSYHDSLSLAFISRYSIAKFVPIDEPTSFVEISGKISMSEHLTRSILRHAIASGIFQEPTPEYIAHNAVSKLLLEPKMDAWVAHSITDVFPAVPMVLESWRQFPAVNEPNETGFSLAIGEGKNLFEYLADNTVARDRFSLAMSGLTAGGAYDVRYLLKGYSWSDIPSGATVIDVGGSAGAVAYALACEYPGLKLIVQDLVGVASQGKEALPLSLRHRITFQAHDFFTPQPIKADIYLLRHVLHDWPDKYCIQILRHLIASMKPSSKIIVNDAIMVEPTKTSAEQYWMMSAMNLQMVTMLNAKERTLQDWTSLFAETDPRLTIASVSSPIGSQMSVLELVLST